MRGFLKKMSLLLCTCVFLMGNAHVSFADSAALMEAFFTKPEGYSGIVEVPGRGSMRYYAQNDPLWALLCYERKDVPRNRPFKDSGCGPTAVAIAVAALVEEADLSRIADYASKEYSLCSCSINKVKCDNFHTRYVLTSQRDFVRFLPLVIADFATGNNTFGVSSRGEAAGTAANFMRYIAEIYGLTMEKTSDFSLAAQAARDGKAVVALASAGSVLTSQGHYVVLAHADDEKIYILDPLFREAYTSKQANKLEIIQPGLVSLNLDQVAIAQLTTFYVFSK